MLRFGVELEVSNLSVSNAIDIFRGKLYSNIFSNWQIKEDGSLKPYGVELVSPIFLWDKRGRVFDVIDILKRNWAKCNQSCGFHVHMSGDFPNKWEDMKPIIKKWYERIKVGFRPARQRRDEYCKELLNQAKYSICRPVIIHPETADSYCNGIWLVTQPHIEVRLFNMRLCKRWIHRCLKATQLLGETLENLKPAVCQSA